MELGNIAGKKKQANYKMNAKENLIFIVCPSSGDEQDRHTHHGKHGPCDGLPAQTLLEKEITDRQHKDRREGR